MNDRTPDSRTRRGPVARLIDRIDDIVSARADRRAREMGLTITRVGDRPRTHIYRSAVWDRRRLCSSCSGAGMNGAAPCGSCEGTGVVTLGVPTEAGDR